MKEIYIDEGSASARFVNKFTPKYVSSYSKRFGIDRLTNSFIGSNKKILTKNVCDTSMIVYAAKSLVPNFLNYFSGRKCITDIQIDEQRNVMYVLSSNLR